MYIVANDDNGAQPGHKLQEPVTGK
jgi:hypothetical protein